MYQPPINSFFNTRKRCASEYLSAPTSKKLLLASDGDALKISEVKNEEKGQTAVEVVQKAEDGTKVETNLKTNRKMVSATRKRALPAPKVIREASEVLPSNTSQENIDNNEKKSMDLSIKEVREKVKKSKKLVDLKEQLKKLQELERKRQILLKQNTSPAKVTQIPEEGQSLKKFDKLDLEVFTSPTKVFKSPIKMRTPTPTRPDSGLMSPRKESILKGARKMLFSPVKDDTSSTEVPAYEKYAHLVEAGRPGIQLPFKYRQLMEIFKSCDAVCAMFHNRKETITFKKLKPAVQQLCRKNFHPSHLAQIKTIFPESYHFHQSKTRNYGSTSKQDYYQLVIEPQLGGRKDHLSPQLLIERQKIFSGSLEVIVRRKHDSFLKSLQPPMMIPMEKITRWHPEFDLESCPVIQEAPMPRPPNEEKFSSAKDVLSAAKNLFNCSTSLERTQEIMESQEPPKIPESPVSALLKRVPPKLLEKIRAKQAAKTLDAMTRRPSQEAEALTYSRLPDLAKHIRNIFLTEKKACLPLDLVLSKLSNSFRQKLPQHELEDLLKILAREVGEWLSLEELRKVKYVKLTRNIDFWAISRKLERLATEKSA